MGLIMTLKILCYDYEAFITEAHTESTATTETF